MKENSGKLLKHSREGITFLEKHRNFWKKWPMKDALENKCPAHLRRV